jgi:colanic acid biosynthesis glycosyl transferase WcaI
VKVTFLTPYFPPEVGAPQTRIYELAVRLAARGHHVSVVTTFPNYPNGVVPEEWRGHLYLRGEDQGIAVHRLWTYVVPNRGFLKRVLSQLSFAAVCCAAAPLIPKADVFIVESPPLFTGIAGMLLSSFRRTPFVFTVADLWPESAVQMGMLRNRTLIKLAKWLELTIYRRARMILATAAGIKQRIEADGIAANKVVLFRNAVDAEFFKPRKSSPELREEMGVAQGEFLALYAGTHGLAHGLKTVLDTAAIFQENGISNVRFVLAGDGADKAYLIEEAERMGLRNVKFLKPFPKNRMPEVLNSADCLLVPLKPLEIFQGVLPSKLFEAMACAKPVVLSVSGEAAEIVSEAGAGIVIEQDNPGAMFDAIRELMDDALEAKAMGTRGRDHVVRHFSRDSRALQLEAALQQLFVIPEETVANVEKGV